MKINTQFYISLLIVLSIAGCNITKQSTEVVQIETPVQLENKISISDSKKELHVPKNYTVHCNPFAEYQFVKPYSKPYSWENYRREILNSQGYQTYLTPANNDKIKQPAISIFFTTDDSFFDQIDLKADNVSNTKIANTNAYTIQFPDLERIIVVNSKGTYQIDLVNFTDSEQDVKSNFLESFTLDINHELCITKRLDPVVIGNYQYDGTQLVAELKNQNLNFVEGNSEFSIANGQLDLFQKDKMLDSKYYYNGLSINLPNKKYQDLKLIYECSSPLIQNQPYFDCETNSTDYLTQYEFGKDYYQFSTGGGYPLTWKKIYIKRINNIDIVFEGRLVANSYWPTDDEPQAKINQIESKQYLDYIKSLPINQYNEKLWENIIDSFDVSMALNPNQDTHAGFYKNNFYSFKHNPNFIISNVDTNSSTIKISNISLHDSKTHIDGFTGSDFVIELDFQSGLNPGNWVEQTQWPYNPIGELIKEDYIPVNGVRSYERIHEGMGWMETYKQKQTHHQVFYPAKNGENLFTLTLQTSSKNYAQAYQYLLEIIESIELQPHNSAIDPKTFSLNHKIQGPLQLSFYRDQTLPASQISFYYNGGFIQNTLNKLQQVFISPKTNKREINTQDEIEVFQKHVSDNLRTTVTKIIQRQVEDLDRCEIKIEAANNGVRAYVEYKDEFKVDNSICDKESDQVACAKIQFLEYENHAKEICSTYESSGFDNYFLYQPYNDTRQIVFINHIFGLDAAPWLSDTIRLK